MKYHVSVTLNAEVVIPEGEKFSSTVICNYITLNTDGNVAIGASTDKVLISGITTSVHQMRTPHGLSALDLGAGARAVETTEGKERTKEDIPY